MSHRPLAQIGTIFEDVESESCPEERQALARELQRAVFETVVSEAVEMVNVWEIDSFDAADLAAAKHNYEDFHAVLKQVRAEVTTCDGRSQ